MNLTDQGEACDLALRKLNQQNTFKGLQHPVAIDGAYAHVEILNIDSWWSEVIVNKIYVKGWDRK